MRRGPDARPDSDPLDYLPGGCRTPLFPSAEPSRKARLRFEGPRDPPPPHPPLEPAARSDRSIQRPAPYRLDVPRMPHHEIPLSRPDITDVEVEIVSEVMRSGRLALG